jgi:hypothetical protein
MEAYFILDEHGEPLPVSDKEVWSRWFEQADLSVARTGITADITILTTFRGVDEGETGAAPLLFHTRVFGGVLDGEEVLHGTRAAALAGHDALTEWCRIGNSPDLGIAEDQIT